jgi:integrase
MGWQHVRDGYLHVRQQKTGVELDIPIPPALQAVLGETPKTNLTFLMTQFEKPFEPAGFGNWFREVCNKAGLPNCSAHGLRKAAARRLADYGCTTHEIAAITGHASLREVQRYTRGADQKPLATAAADKVKSGTSNG